VGGSLLRAQLIEDGELGALELVPVGDDGVRLGQALHPDKEAAAPGGGVGRQNLAERERVEDADLLSCRKLEALVEERRDVFGKVDPALAMQGRRLLWAAADHEAAALRRGGGKARAGAAGGLVGTGLGTGLLLLWACVANA
jgi:hypothetical protein